MRDRERGTSILEIKIVLVIFTMTLLAAYSAYQSQRRCDRLVDGYAGDVLGCRRALEAVEPDLREATGVFADVADAVRIETTRGIAEYRLRDGVLTRSTEGDVRVVARNIGAFEVVPEGVGFRVRLGPGPREGRGGAGARLSTRIVPRIAEGGR